MTGEEDPLGVCGLTVAGKYHVERLAGVGGFAVVYRAQHRLWKKPVAIKFFNLLGSAGLDERARLQDAFVREGALLGELSSHSASIVQAWDVGTFTTPDGEWLPYMVLEWLDGEPLDVVLRREHASGMRQRSLEQVYQLLQPVADALDVAHQRGIAHRDVKPANLLVMGNPRGSDVAVKVLDFGVAKVMSENTQAALTNTGTHITSFTPEYGAPEQFNRAHGATGPWTDVYALALIGVELLSGRSAFRPGELVDLALQSADPAQRPTPAAFGVFVPPHVEAIFVRALAVRPQDRYPSAGAFWSELGRALGHRTLTARTLQPEEVISVMPQIAAAHASVRPPERRVGLWLVLLSLLMVLALGGTLFGVDYMASRDANALPALEGIPRSRTAASYVARNTCPAGMVRIPEGQFFMGSDQPDALPNEKPSFQVTLPAFCLDVTEVTVQAYQACSDVGKCRRAPQRVQWPGMSERESKIYTPLCNAGVPGREQHPINCLSWDMAHAYCKARGGRLPREAEWEYATRGPDGRIYPWGDDAPSAVHLNACGTECVAWAEKHGETLGALYEADDGYTATAPVGKFPAGASRFGPLDVAGNVWEWVADWYGPYTPSAKSAPSGPETGERRVIRGGAWNGAYATWLRPSFRYAQAPDALSHGIGFRCAASLGTEG